MQISVLQPIVYELAKAKSGKKPREYTIDVFHASEIGGCPRALYYLRSGAEAIAPWPKNYLRLEDGTNVHTKLQKYLKEAGILLEKEGLVKDELLGIRGHFDGVIHITLASGEEITALLEIKTINKEDFKTLVKPKRSHMIQANFYAVKKGVKYILFLYYCIENAKIKEFLEVTDVDLYAQTIETVKKIKGCLVKGEPPAEKHEEDCYFCSYIRICRNKKEGDGRCLVL